MSAKFDVEGRRRRCTELMEAEGLEALFVSPSADFEYLTGIERRPRFAGIGDTDGGLTDAFALLRPGADPVLVVPHWFVHELSEVPAGEVVIVRKVEDGWALLERLLRGAGSVGVCDGAGVGTLMRLAGIVGFEKLRRGSPLVGRLRQVKEPEEVEALRRACAIADEAMAAVAPLVAPGVTMNTVAAALEEAMRSSGSPCPAFPPNVFGRCGEDHYLPTFSIWTDNGSGDVPVPEGTSVGFDFGAVADGYCSDFGRTVYCGEPPADYREAHEVVLASQQAGQAAATAGAPCNEVDAACRRVILDAGLPDYPFFTGHSIGLDAHEAPWISTDDTTPMPLGMAFTIEPMIIVPGSLWVRFEDIYVCESDGSRRLNQSPTDLLANP